MKVVSWLHRPPESEGRVVERGPTLDLIEAPKDAYPKKLLDAVPNPFA